MRTRTWLIFGALLTGCLEPSPSTRDAGGRDASSPTDTGVEGTDAGAEDDAGVTADAGVDAGATDTDAGEVDAGAVALAIDGVLAAGEWAAAGSATNGTASDWGPTLNRLDALHLHVDDTYVWIALEGAVEEMNGIVVYVDGHDGAGICDLSTLTDSTGAVDDRLSAGFVTDPSFCADAGWSTRYFDRAAVADDPDLGWRDLDTGDPGNIAWVPVGEAPTVCGPSACETRIPRTQIGIVAGETVSVFARLGNATGTGWSNQTLPEDAPSSPQTVSAVLEQVAP